MLRLNGMAAGQYDFFFGIDMTLNGWIDVGTLYYDSVSVTVAP